MKRFTLALLLLASYGKVKSSSDFCWSENLGGIKSK